MFRGSIGVRSGHATEKKKTHPGSSLFPRWNVVGTLGVGSGKQGTSRDRRRVACGDGGHAIIAHEWRWCTSGHPIGQSPSHPGAHRRPGTVKRTWPWSKVHLECLRPRVPAFGMQPASLGTDRFSLGRHCRGRLLLRRPVSVVCGGYRQARSPRTAKARCSGLLLAMGVVHRGSWHRRWWIRH